MNFFEPLENIVNLFNEKGIKYAIIGGIANSYYSEPRQTNIKELSDWLGNTDFYDKLIEIKNEK
jgi:hypothetical protein